MTKRIDQWCLVLIPHSDFIQLPEDSTQHLHGIVSGHDRVTNGTETTTSRIVGKRNGRVVTYSGSEYELGEVKADYDAQFPGAPERLMRTLPEISSPVAEGAVTK